MHYCDPHHVRSSKLFKSFSYSNVFSHYECLFMSSQNGNYLSVLSHLMALFLVSINIFKETYILLELPFNVELSGLFSTLDIKVPLINPFTAEDTIWRPGGITHLSITS